MSVGRRLFFKLRRCETFSVRIRVVCLRLAGTPNLSTYEFHSTPDRAWRAP